jgi:putative transposase
MVKKKEKIPPETQMWKLIFPKNKQNSIVWQTSVPFDIRNNAVRDAHKAWISVQKKWELKEKAEIHFRKKKILTQSILLPKSCLGTNTFYISYMNIVKAKHSLKSDGDTRLVKTPLGYELHIIQKSLLENQEKVRNVIALDPGVRTFMTGFDNNGVVDICGQVETLCKLKNAYYKLRWKAFKTSARSRQRMIKASYRINRRIQNLINEMHYKTIKYLTDNYSDIILPCFYVSQMTRKKNRRINKKTVQSMLLLSHYKFRDRLVRNATRDGVNVWLSNESYTSKTCTKCGHEHKKLGGSKIFKCPSCNLNIDRDINGARNILLRVISEFSP